MQCLRARRNLIKPRVGCILQLLIIQNHRERPPAGLLRSGRMHHVQNVLRLRIVHILLQLPALHHRAAVRNLHAIKIVLDHNRAFLRIALGRHAYRRCRGNCCCGVRCLRGGSRGCCRRRRPGRCRSAHRRPVRLWRWNRRLRPKKFRPKQNHAHRQQRRHKNSQLRRELVLLSRQAHKRTSFCVAAMRLEEIALAFISEVMFSHFSGTGSYPVLRQNGWHRKSRFVPSQIPLSTPNRSIASYAYREQLG